MAAPRPLRKGGCHHCAVSIIYRPSTASATKLLWQSGQTASPRRDILGRGARSGINVLFTCNEDLIEWVARKQTDHFGPKSERSSFATIYYGCSVISAQHSLMVTFKERT